MRLHIFLLYMIVKNTKWAPNPVHIVSNTVVTVFRACFGKFRGFRACFKNVFMIFFFFDYVLNTEIEVLLSNVKTVLDNTCHPNLASKPEKSNRSFLFCCSYKVWNVLKF